MDFSAATLRHTRRRLAIHLPLPALLVMSLALAACGASTVNDSGTTATQTPSATQTAQAKQTSTASEGTLAGDVVAGPISPVEREGDPNTKPVPNREVRIETADGKLVTTTTTDANGHFQVSLAPGTYVVRIAIVSGLIGMRQNNPPPVQVVAGQTSYVKIELDTGIR